MHGLEGTLGDAAPRPLDEVQRLARDYASFARSRGGLGNVLGGAVGLAIYLINGLAGPGVWTTALTIGLTLVWLIGKEIIRRRLYRTFGEAEEPWPAQERRNHMLSVGFVALVVAAIWIFFLVQGAELRPRAWPYLGFITAMPLVAWRYLRTSGEFMVGIFLIAACAVTSVGGAYALWLQLQVPIYAIMLIGAGLVEHRRFRELAAELGARHGDEE